jgi:hypothetical protein
MQKEQSFTFHITHDQQGQYLTVPFEMPEKIGKLTLVYEYPKRESLDQPIEGGNFKERQRLNTVDLGLVALGNRQVAATGSDKKTITLTENWATPGCIPCKLEPGIWQILVGAYHVAPEGVDVQYTLTFEEKTPRWLTGDLHTHTLASDGSKTALELCQHAQSQGLDFVAITDHNQFVKRASLPQLPDFTVIPGVEWTHYRGHSNFLGLDQPYDEPFFTNEELEVSKRFQEAHARGALIVLNHTHDDDLPFSFNTETLPYDCLEIWNGPMRLSNLRAVAAWQARLVQGEKTVMVCGSDYHKDGLFQILGGPSLRVFAQSESTEDILAAIRQGHTYAVYQADGPRLDLQCGEALLGDSLPWREGLKLSLRLDGLYAGDEVRLVGKTISQTVFKAQKSGLLELETPVLEAGFLRLELWRTLYAGVPALPLLISNPIWFY